MIQPPSRKSAPHTPWALLGPNEIFATPKELPRIIQGLSFYSGATTIVAASSHCGKSYLAQSLALCCTAGVSVWGRFSVSRAMRVLFVDFEQGSFLTCRRFVQLAAALGLGPDALGDRLKVVVFPADRLDQPGAAQVWETECAGFDIVIVDTMRAAAPGLDENDSKFRIVLDILNWIADRHGVCFIVLHHFGKRIFQEPTADALRGSSAIKDAVSAIYGFIPRSGGRRLYTLKDRFRELPPPVTVDFVSDGSDALLVTAAHAAYIEPARSPRKGKPSRDYAGEILVLLVDRPVATQADIADAIGARRQEVNATLKDLLKNNIIKKTEQGYQINEEI